MNKKIAIIGTGHMGRALFKGFINSKKYFPSDFLLTNHHRGKLSDLEKDFEVTITDNNRQAVRDADIIFICVKPKAVSEVIREFKSELKRDKLIISVAACVTMGLLEKYINDHDIKVVRIIPNIPVNYGMGVVGWFGNNNIDQKDRKFITNLLSVLGKVVDCKNDEGIEKLSVIAGCGIGYIAFFMESLEKITGNYGFSPEDAYEIVMATFEGTVKQLRTSGQKFEELRISVATKGGLTEEIINSLNEGKFAGLLTNSIRKGYTKAWKINQEIEQNIK